MTQRLSAEPGTAAAVAAEPAPSVALHGHAAGPQPVAGNTGADVDQTARLAAAGSDQRRIAVARSRGFGELRDGRQEPAARRRDVETGCADRQLDAAQFLGVESGRGSALPP